MRHALAAAAFALAAVVAGASFVVQSSVNAKLRAVLDAPYTTALISYAGGTVVMALCVLFLRERVRLGDAFGHAPWWVWTGGLWGAIYVVIIILLLHRVGAAVVIASFVLGQMVTSLVVDHFGLFGVPRHPVDAARIAGAALLVAGVTLIRR
ncbi:MAG TPA: DMT family transporter [Candidatus Elarobacter sp.]|jgi:transporter family-2 protein